MSNETSSQSPAQTPLSALVDILSSQVKVLESAYAEKQAEFPSLDAPFQQSLIDQDEKLGLTARLVVAAAAQIIATVRAPLETLQEYSTASYAAASLNLVNDVHVANILKDAGPQGLHAQDISAQAGVPAERLARLLRYLASRHIFKEVAPDIFANNRVSSVLIKQKSLEELEKDLLEQYGNSGVAAFVGHASDEGMKGAVELASWVKDSSKSPTPFNAGNRTSQNLFKWFENEDNKLRGKRFNECMTMSGSAFPPSIFLEGFEWDKLRSNAVIVDVGGNVGSVAMTVLQKNRHLQVVVQDLDNVIEDARKYWETLEPDAVSDGRVKFQAIDFFQSQPVKNADVYFMRAVLHDWPSDKCRTILKLIREAASPSSKLVVFDMMMPYACQYDGPFAEVVSAHKPPAPLLANLGMGFGAFISWVDIQMMNFFNGQERTVGQFIELGDATGWKLESVRPGMMAALVFAAA